MQLTVKSTKVAKTGTNKSGDWELIVVTTEDNTDYTTFDKKAKHLNSGAVIEIEPIIKEGKISFKDFTVVSEGQVATSLETKPNDMTPEMWADKDRITRASIEGQVAMKCYTDLVVAKIDKIPELLLDALTAKIQGFTEDTNPSSPPATVKSYPEEAAKDIEELWGDEKTKSDLSKSIINQDWLKESIKELQDAGQKAYSDESLLTFMRSSYKDIKGDTIYEIASKLDKGGAKHFGNTIKDALSKL